MDISNQRVLVTGSGGFIGSHLTEALLKKNCTVRALVHYNSFNRWGWLDMLPATSLKNIEVIAGDVRDPNGVTNAMKDVDVVFHLAALIGIPYSYHSPDMYVETNIKGTLNILQSARNLGIQKIIHTSTSEIYGTAQFVPITEEHPVHPQSPYAATKSGADFLALSFFRSFETPVVIVRPFNTYGPRQSARAVVPTIITQVMAGKERIGLGSLTPTRDLNFVADTVKGFIRAAEAENVNGEVINIGSGKEISIGDLAQLIARIMNKKITTGMQDERIRPQNSEVERLLADNTKAGALLDWSPEYTLEEGLNETIKWFSDKRNLDHYKSDIYNV